LRDAPRSGSARTAFDAGDGRRADADLSVEPSLIPAGRADADARWSSHAAPPVRHGGRSGADRDGRHNAAARRHRDERRLSQLADTVVGTSMRSRS
jgi:hypothetical protein